MNTATSLFYGFDTYYLILVIPAILLSLVASSRVKSTFARYSRESTRAGFTGESAARQILDAQGLQQVRIEHVSGHLTDHYDPRTQILRLSDATYTSRSIAAIGVAAHEAGHAIQHDEGYWPNKVRSALVPVANIGSQFGPYMAIFGIILGFSPLINIGIALFAGAVLFYLITLPVEFDASRRAIVLLEQQQLLDTDELTGAKKVLRAAAMTYIASTIVAFANLLRLILLARGRNDRRN
ncbi:MAG: zinc metallopeptidase [Eubacteriales bacterium]|nr:zinc metallopeptidase [Eubacteriales bacterium]